jgi:hypothetical protein
VQLSQARKMFVGNVALRAESLAALDIAVQ